eukprot:gene44199-54042_t
MSNAIQSKVKVLQESISDSSSDEEENVVTRSHTSGWALKRHKGSDEHPSRSRSSSISMRSEGASPQKSSKPRAAPAEPPSPAAPPSSPPLPAAMEDDTMLYPLEEELFEEEGHSSDVEIVKDLARFTRPRSFSEEPPISPPHPNIQLVNAAYKQSIQPLPYNPDDHLPLRKRALSDLLERPADVSRASAGRTDRETPEKWRGRLWPKKALPTYCRVITRCQPPSLLAPGKWGELVAHWRSSDVGKIGTSFSSLTAHSTSFFLLTVEESRDAVMNSEDSGTAGKKRLDDDEEVEIVDESAVNSTNTYANTSLPSSSSSSSNPSAAGPAAPPPSSIRANWQECEVLNIVAET